MRGKMEFPSKEVHIEEFGFSYKALSNRELINRLVSIKSEEEKRKYFFRNLPIL